MQGQTCRPNWRDSKYRLGVSIPRRKAGWPSVGVSGAAATAFATDAVRAARRVVIRNPKWGKWGDRVIADVLIDGRNLAKALIEAGLARRYDVGRGRAGRGRRRQSRHAGDLEGTAPGWRTQRRCRNFRPIRADTGPRRRKATAPAKATAGAVRDWPGTGAAGSAAGWRRRRALFGGASLRRRQGRAADEIGKGRHRLGMTIPFGFRPALVLFRPAIIGAVHGANAARHDYDNRKRGDGGYDLGDRLPTSILQGWGGGARPARGGGGGPRGRTGIAREGAAPTPANSTALQELGGGSGGFGAVPAQPPRAREGDGRGTGWTSGPGSARAARDGARGRKRGQERQGRRCGVRGGIGARGRSLYQNGKRLCYGIKCLHRFRMMIPRFLHRFHMTIPRFLRRFLVAVFFRFRAALIRFRAALFGAAALPIEPRHHCDTGPYPAGRNENCYCGFHSRDPCQRTRQGKGRKPALSITGSPGAWRDWRA